MTTEAIKTCGNLATNDREIAVNWALDGHGILMRAEWDIAQRHRLAARVRALVDFVARSFSAL